ncbi:MAG: hypothetical protein B6I38_11700 [Anaerolineaceae bacterium 4572_5.1]|nr:MAG: hypothetical protein B6I38_11700 [Anaerolineaceae bacterium 4572_5.1]
MPLTIEEAIARVPQWANATDLKSSPLTGGITNENFRIEVNGDVSEVFYVIEPEGYLIASFIEGKLPSLSELGQRENIKRVADAVHRVHSLPPIPETFSPFRVVENSAEIARQYNVDFPDNFGELVNEMNAAETALNTSPFTPRLCHNDLLNANFLDDGQIRILDWEYAGMGDPLFDLANFAVHHEFNDEQDRWLLESYFGEITDENWARLKILKIISDFREAMWAMVQIGISKLDFDFIDYANTYFARTEKGMDGEMWQEWLEDVEKVRIA